MEKHKPFEKLISVCTNIIDEANCCERRGGTELVEILKAYVKENGLKGEIRVARSGCLGLCDVGPNISVYPDGGESGTWYKGVTKDDLPSIIDKHIKPLIKK